MIESGSAPEECFSSTMRREFQNTIVTFIISAGIIQCFEFRT